MFPVSGRSLSETVLQAHTLLQSGNLRELQQLTTQMAVEGERLPRDGAAEVANALARGAIQAPSMERWGMVRAALFHVPKADFYREHLTPDEFASFKQTMDEVTGSQRSTAAESSDSEDDSRRGRGKGRSRGKGGGKGGGKGYRTASSKGGWSDAGSSAGKGGKGKGGSDASSSVGKSKGKGSTSGRGEKKPMWELMKDTRSQRWTRMPFDFSVEAEAAFVGKASLPVVVGQGSWNTKGARYSLHFGKMTCLLKDSHGEKLVPLRRLDGQENQTHPDPKSEHPRLARLKSGVINDWLTDDAFFTAFSAHIGLGAVDPSTIFAFKHNEDWRGYTREFKPSKRGGVDYYVPIGCKRFAVKVKGKYDGGDNTWMRMDDKGWAVAYHGTSQAGCWAILQQGLQAGGGQAHASGTDVRTGQTIGKGIYCSPGLSVPLNYGDKGASIAGHPVQIVMQCRVRPSAIKRCHDENSNRDAYWVINDPNDIRPYGVLVKPK